jgi:site-specific recombinase XerD
VRKTPNPIWNNVDKYPVSRTFIDSVLKDSNVNNPKEEWLKEIKETSRHRYAMRFDEFCQWVQKSPEQLFKQYKDSSDKEAWAKAMGSIIVQYYQARLSAGYSINSARADTVAPRSFFSSQCQEVKIAKGKIAKAQIATGEHSFTQDELKKMFHFGDVKSKAILSTAVSLGWSSIDFLSLEVNFIKPFIEKAKTEKSDFVQFIYTRQKTDETAICHLMPEAIESLDAYLKTVPEDAKFLWYSPSNHNEPLTNKALNDQLKSMVQQASTLVTGDIKFNLLRKFTFSTLQRYGMTESESRVCVGKTVGADVLTYLINLKDTLLEKYRKAYHGLTLVKSNGNGRIDNIQTALDTVMQVLKGLMEDKLTEKGLLKTRKPIDWQKLYESIIPEEERREKVQLD